MKKVTATKLASSVQAFLSTVSIVPFDSKAAIAYGQPRAQYEQQGLSVGTIDGLIAAHALSTDSTLIIRDRALLRLDRWLPVDMW